MEDPFASPDRAPPPPSAGTAFGAPRDFLGNRFIYAVLSPRARGLTLGVNMNPDRFCNFDCVYCEVDRRQPVSETRLDLPVMLAELERSLGLIHSGQIRERPNYRAVPAELLQLRHICLSGDGEPTLCPNFQEVVESLVHVRARGRFPYFRLVLVTNASGLDRPEVRAGLNLFNPTDEVWAKIEAGTPEYQRRVNQPDCTIEHIQAGILGLARERPITIQSLFPAIRGEAPSAQEIESYVRRLQELKDAGAQVALVQIYSATRPTPHSECGHLPLRTLSAIAQRVRETTGLKAEVF